MIVMGSHAIDYVIYSQETEHKTVIKTDGSIVGPAVKSREGMQIFKGWSAQLSYLIRCSYPVGATPRIESQCGVRCDEPASANPAYRKKIVGR